MNRSDERRRETLLGPNPWGGYNHNALGCEFFQMRSWDKAAFEFERAVEINPWEAYFKGNLARAYAAAGELDKAEEAARAGLKQNPALPGILFALGLIYEKRGLAGEALEFYRACLAAKPSYFIRIDAEESIKALLKQKP